MDTQTLSSVQRKKVTKKSKTKKNPIKVVYISNPMKVNTSAAEFRALVQELTGQDAELPPDPTTFSEHSVEEYVGGFNHDENQSVNTGCLISKDGHGVINHEHDREVDNLTHGVKLFTQDQQRLAEGSFSDRIEQLDEVCTTQMIENLPGFSPASAFYESVQMDHVLRNFDTM